MFVKSYKVTARRLAGIGIMCVAVMMLVVYGIGQRISKAQEGYELEAGASLNKKLSKNTVKTAAERLAFLSRFGWEAEEEPQEIAEIVIPEEFDEVYEKYNTLQKAQGYDLTRHKGERCKRYTYKLTNYPACPDYARANLLVLQGKVIGGDVCSTQLDGFMHGFAADSATMEEVAVLPLPAGAETARVFTSLPNEAQQAEASINAAEEAMQEQSAEPPIEDTMAEELAAMLEALMIPEK